MITPRFPPRHHSEYSEACVTILPCHRVSGEKNRPAWGCSTAAAVLTRLFKCHIQHTYLSSSSKHVHLICYVVSSFQIFVQKQNTKDTPKCIQEHHPSWAAVSIFLFVECSLCKVYAFEEVLSGIEWLEVGKRENTWLKRWCNQASGAANVLASGQKWRHKNASIVTQNLKT